MQARKTKPLSPSAQLNESELSKIDADEDEDAIDEEILLERERNCLQNAGLFFTYVSKKCFIVWLKHLALTNIQISQEGSDGVKIEWKVQPPDAIVLAAPGIRDTEVPLFPTSQAIVLHAPRPLTRIPNNYKKIVIPADAPEWLIVSYPWRREEEDAPAPITF